MVVFKALIRWFAIALLVFALSCLFVVIFQAIFSPFHIVVSNSMYPQIQKGDAIIMKDVDPNKIKVGDVVIFLDPQEKEQLIVHRVIDIEEGGSVRYFTTKGDNNPQADSQRIPSGGIAGGIALRIPNFGKFLNFLDTKKGYILLVGLPSIASLLLALFLSIVERFSSRTSNNMRGSDFGTPGGAKLF